MNDTVREPYVFNASSPANHNAQTCLRPTATAPGGVAGFTHQCLGTTSRSALAAIALGLFLTSPVRAQETATPVAPSPDGAEPAADKQDGPAQTETETGDIVVTAQRREERLRQVPISMTVLSGEQLDESQATDLLEELTRVAGVSTSENALSGGVTTLQMRGVAPGNALFSGSSPVGYYLDTIPFGLVRSALVPEMGAYDLERVEVLRGPQGTLYGVGSLNGVVRVLTNDAEFNDFDFKMRASTADTKGGSQSYRGDMAVNLPIIDDRLAARVVVGYNYVGGWIDRLDKDDINHSETKTVRLKLNARPTDELSIAASAWVSRRHDGGHSLVDTADDLRTQTLPEPVDSDFDAYSAKIDYDLAALSVSSMTSFIDYKSDGVFAIFDTFGLDFGIKSKVFSQEFSLNSSTDGPLEWSAGAIYRKGEDKLLETAFFIQPPEGLKVNDSSESYAVFGQVTAKFLDDRLRLSGGLRYFHDTVEQEQINVNGTGVDTFSKDTFTATTPRLVATWLPSNDLTVYASYGQGFRSGFAQSGSIQLIAPQFPPAKPDKLSNFEVGTKGRLLNGLVDFDAALYYIHWKDTQQLLTVPNPVAPIQTFTAIVNASAASGVGLDLGINAHPAPGFDVGATFSFNDLHFNDDVISGGEVLFDEGARLLYSPKYNFGVNASYSFDLGGGYTAQLAGSANYNSKVVVLPSIFTFDGARPLIGSDRLIGRASFQISTPKHWDISVFAENLGNERGGFAIAPFALNIRPRPRTVGIQMQYRLR